MSEVKGVEPRATSVAPAPSVLDAPMPGRRMLVNLGPSHPAMHGVTRCVVELNGEVIDTMKLDIGFLHRGFEKSCENVTWTQVFPYTDRLNYVSSIMNNVGFALAVEKLAKIDVPVRAKYLRVLSSEIHRICDHLTLVGAMGMELGAMTVFLYAIEARDLLYDRLAELCGARLTSNYARIGGVTRDLPDGWEEKTLRTLDRVTEVRVEIGQLLDRNRIFLDRCIDTGKVSREDAIELGFTGPCLRASGEPYDIRKAAPYLVYDRLDFDVPVADQGDAYARIAVRVEEIDPLIGSFVLTSGYMIWGYYAVFTSRSSMAAKNFLMVVPEIRRLNWAFSSSTRPCSASSNCWTTMRSACLSLAIPSLQSSMLASVILMSIPRCRVAGASRIVPGVAICSMRAARCVVWNISPIAIPNRPMIQ